MLLAYTPHPAHPVTSTNTDTLLTHARARARTRAHTHIFLLLESLQREISFLFFVCFFVSFFLSPFGLSVANVRFKKKNYQLTRQSILQYKTPFCFIASSQIQSGAARRWRQVSGKSRSRFDPGLLKTNCQGRVAEVQDLSKTLEYAPCSSVPKASAIWSFHAGHLAKGGDNSKKERCYPLPPSFLGSSGKQ